MKIADFCGSRKWFWAVLKIIYTIYEGLHGRKYALQNQIIKKTKKNKVKLNTFIQIIFKISKLLYFLHLILT
jgi:hypothetical protein